MKTNHKFLLSALLASSLSACSLTSTTGNNGSARSQAEAIKAQGGSYKVGNPYKVLDQYYEPAEDYNYSEVGIASWYGSDFHAKKTANGENYDMNTLTAAHRTLPLPSIVKVTNLENGRSLVLRVNDRGPFAKSRIIDISKRGAQLLGFQTQGTAKVRVELLEKESREIKAALLGEPFEEITPAPTKSYASSEIYSSETVSAPLQASSFTENSVASDHGIFVQAGSFAQQSSAEELKRTLEDVGSAQIAQAEINGSRFYRVRFGPYVTSNEAETTLNKVQNLGIHNARIIKD